MSLNVAFVGEELGYFEEEGLQIEEQDAGNMAESAFLANGQTDVVFTGATEILTGISAGVDMRILYEYWYTAAEGVYVSEDSPITSVEELKGKTVGLASDSDLAFLKVALLHYGLTEDDVTTIVVGDQGGVIADALKNGTIAALSGSTGEERSLAGAGVPLRDITPTAVKDTPGETFVALEKMVSEKPDVLQRFFRAWAKASYASTINPDVLLKMGDRNIPEATLDRVQAMIGVEQAHKTDPPNGLYGELRPEIWQRVADALYEAGTLQQPLKLRTTSMTSSSRAPTTSTALRSKPTSRHGQKPTSSPLRTIAGHASPRMTGDSCPNPPYPAAVTVPVAFATMLLVSRLTRATVPDDVAQTFARMHVPEHLGMGVERMPNR